MMMHAAPTNLRMPIGVSNFSELVESNNNSEAYTFIDKTWLIHDFILDGSKVVLWSRPRRFGKTLNLSMLYHFFSCTETREQDLFQGLKIKAADDLCQRYQEQYPTIFISFKEIKAHSFEEAKIGIIKLFRDLFEEHAYLLEGGRLSEQARIIYQQFLAKEPPDDELNSALLLLSKHLYDYHQKKVIILIDEYDTPIHAAHAKQYDEKMIGFMRSLFGSGLKDNDFMHKAGVTGILRVAKENIFSGLNNLTVNSFLDKAYVEYFGFTESEVSDLFQLLEHAVDLSTIQQWYNGYQAREVTLYNPWSIINCLHRGGELGSYWVNTSDNELIKSLLIGGNIRLQADFKRLIQGESIEEVMNPFLTLKDLKNSRTNILTLLCMSGYLNATPIERPDARLRYHLRIPNREVRYLYEETISQWLTADGGITWLEECMNNLKAMRMAAFTESLQDIALNIFSFHDTKGRTSEAFFHGFMLGLVVYCQADYTITSNREAGTGRFDIAMIPKNTDGSLPGILFEIKSLPNADTDTLEAQAHAALQQINTKQYAAVFSAHPQIQQLHIGIAFCGKDLALVHNQLKR